MTTEALPIGTPGLLEAPKARSFEWGQEVAEETNATHKNVLDRIQAVLAA